MERVKAFNLMETIGDDVEKKGNVKAKSRQTTDFISMIHLIANAMQRRCKKRRKENRLRNNLVDYGKLAIHLA